MLVLGAGQRQTVLGRGSRQKQGGATMSRSKQTDKKERGRRTVVTALGAVAGALSLVGGASASSPAGDIPTQNSAPVILAEEEISDVSLSTFYVFDKENAPIHGVRLAQVSVHLGPGGVRVHGGCNRGCGHGGCSRGCGGGCGHGCGGGCSHGGCSHGGCGHGGCSHGGCSHGGCSGVRIHLG
jgi:hypothetical protein